MARGARRRGQGRLRPISHKGLKKLGAASTKTKLPLQLGLIANQSGLQNAVKAGSNPGSSSYGKYPSLSTLQSKYGASSSKRKGVVDAFKKQNVKARSRRCHGLRARRGCSRSAGRTSRSTPGTGSPRAGPGTTYSIAKRNPGAYFDITTGSNALFGGSCCPARPGFDLATGVGLAAGERHRRDAVS